MARVRASFEVIRVTDSAVYLEDMDGPVSITNDAEAVSQYVFEKHGDVRIFYIDTQKARDELVHTKGRFNTFKCGWPPAGSRGDV